MNFIFLACTFISPTSRLSFWIGDSFNECPIDITLNGLRAGYVVLTMDDRSTWFICRFDRPRTEPSPAWCVSLAMDVQKFLWLRIFLSISVHDDRYDCLSWNADEETPSTAHCRCALCEHSNASINAHPPCAHVHTHIHKNTCTQADTQSTWPNIHWRMTESEGRQSKLDNDPFLGVDVGFQCWNESQNTIRLECVGQLDAGAKRLYLHVS